MDFLNLLHNPAIAGIFGLAVGLVIAIVVFVIGLFQRSTLVQENASILRNHVKMHDTGHKKLIEELEETKKKNENLRATVATLKTKPGRAELRTLHLYDSAIRKMSMRAPGFAPVWESVLNESDLELQQADNGLIAFFRRAIRPALPAQIPAQTPPAAPEKDQIRPIF